MKTDKEYPATHSMSTAWYCADEDGNVAIIDIEDNGPVPEDGYKQNSVEEVFWEDFAHKERDFRKLNLKPEQIPQMLEPSEIEDVWEPDAIGDELVNVSWMNVIIQIDMDKFDILKKAISLDKSSDHPLVCLSEEQGLFYVDFFFNKAGVELLEQNNVIKAKYRAPEYETPYDISDCKEKTRPFTNLTNIPLICIYRTTGHLQMPQLDSIAPTVLLNWNNCQRKYKRRYRNSPLNSGM